MNNYRKYFDGGLNADDDFELQKKGEWINASNLRVFTTDTGATGRLEAVGGNSLLFNNLPSGTNYCIGGCVDEGSNRLIFFNWNSGGEHGIYCFDRITLNGYIVLLSSGVTGGLGFSKDRYIHSCFYANGSVYWVNGDNTPPRRVNIESGIQAYTTFVSEFTPYVLPIKQSVISWIRKPGVFPPSINKLKQTSPAVGYNALKSGAFQFCYRYNYRDHEVSTLSALSILANYNAKDDDSNCIDVQIPSAEIIEQDVLSIDLVVRYLSNETNLEDGYFVIKTWSKDVTSEAVLIANHSVIPLTFRFYNDITGIALDDVYKTLPYHNVPLLAETTEVAKNRSFMANYTEGYDTPAGTSLSINYTTTNIPSGALITITGVWYNLRITNYDGSFTDIKLLRTTEPIGPVPPSQYYWYMPPIVVPPYPTTPYPSTIDRAGFTYVGGTFGTTYYQVMTYFIAHGYPYIYNYVFTNQSASSTITGSSTLSNYISKAFKSGANYQLAITFYDEYQRKCGVKTKDIVARIPEALIPNNYVKEITWQLIQQTSINNEIPIWAHYYSINVTKCLSTRFFLQGAGTVTYADKNITTGVYSYTNTYDNKLVGIAIDISSLLSFNMGYLATAGDIAKLKIGSTQYAVSVISNEGKYLIVELADFGTYISPQQVIFEIYRPYKTLISEPFYEVGKMYAVNTPELSSRTYSTLTDVIAGDIYLYYKNYGALQFVVETMNLNDKYWKIWNTDCGRLNAIDTIGQKKLTSSIAFSDVYIEGTKVNGLSSFTALNTEALNADEGAIRKLQLSNKVQSDGTVMLSICENETVSMYLGEQEMFDTQGSAFIARASAVIGSSKSLKGSMGTKNPESVFEYNGLVFWYDSRNGSFVQYANNGLFPISKNNLTRASNQFSKKFSFLTAAQVEALGSRPYVIGGYDPYHKEALFTIPSTEAIPPKGYLEDYTSVVYPYDIYDGIGKTLVYKNERDKWIGSMPFKAEKIIRMGNDLYTLNNGRLYIHNQNNTANFYGTQYSTKLMYSNNPGGVHTFLSLGLESNMKPTYVHLRTEDPYVQSSDLVGTEFSNKEGVKYATVLKDRLSPNTTGTYLEKQMKGDKLFGKALLVMLQYEFILNTTFDSSFDNTFYDDASDTSKLELRFSDVGNIINPGHLFNNG